MNVLGYTESGMIRAEMGEVEILVPDDISNRHRQMIAEWEGEGNTIPPYTAPGPSEPDVDAERNRRIDAGFVFEGVHYQSRAEDRENIAGAKAAATDAITLFGAEAGNFAWQQLLDPGAPPEFRWIAADNDTHPMDAQTVMRFGYAALNHKQAHILAARTLKNMSPIPADYATNPDYWP
ncbi:MULTISPECIES: DUF4376 domain-containing protein [Agrobacterium]|uniref:DUF4376 domain-containing protein n=2 Tax=Pseudomonadota TaxID=1224 RepID=UPI002300FE5B|nr:MULTISPECIES: DUF4376 domain-containing protein [Agrobacterium]MDA5627771.1 DUF4376 domain-containing protein [Agrobacterium sp. ST15.16.055]MDA6978481.1 DUF4376 domain-containing protein [Agrobacterium salinitolerans]